MAGHLLRWRPVGTGLYLAEVATTAALFLGALLAGAGIVDRIGGDAGARPAEWWLHSLAIGLGLPVLAVLFLGLAGVLSRTSAVVAASLVLAVGMVASRRVLSRLRTSLAHAVGDLRTPHGAAAATVLGAALLLPFATALLPEVFYDALLYHLEAPERWLRDGGLTAVPFSFHLNYPINVSALYLLVRSVVPEASGGLVHWGFLVASAGALLALGGRAGKGVGIVAALLFCITPSVLEIGGQSIADLAVVFWTLAAASAWLIWRERGERGWLILCGLEIGLAIGAKYTAILVALAPILLLTLLLPGRRALGTRARDLALVGVAVLAAFSPWLIRNGLETGNPLYPYLLPTRAEFTTPHSLQTELENRMVEGSGPVRILRHAMAGPRELVTTGVGAAPLIGMSLLLPLPLLLLRRPLLPDIARLLALGGLGFLAWDLTVHVTRYALPWLALLSVPAAAALLGDASRLRRRLLMLVVALGLCQNFHLAWMTTDWTALRDILSGSASRESYVEKYVSYYGAVQHANGELSADDRILFFGEARGFYCRIPHVTNGPERPPRLFEIAAAEPGRPLAEVLLGRGFTHILMSRSEIRRLTSQGRLGFPGSAVQSAVERLLEGETEILYDDGNVLLAALRRPALSPGAPPPR